MPSVGWIEVETAAVDHEVRVLVADDAEDVAEVVAHALTLDGYSVRIAPDGEQAKAMVAEFSPHCVLFDVDMPNLDGNQLSTWLRQQYGDDIVLIAMTGWSDTDRRVADTFIRVDHYLRKPIDLDTLRRVLPPVKDS